MLRGVSCGVSRVRMGKGGRTNDAACQIIQRRAVCHRRARGATQMFAIDEGRERGNLFVRFGSAS